ncbi:MULTISPECIES: glycine zipper 2TM domain-containing protein [Thermomonas]|jgi:uncharacterized protein YcfJ|uniref:glycine zipper 2TM domain-containing protein n=1 Tax=Thermomonas TaxID=141948 RepID=UPI00040DF8AF|nr:MULTISPECIES: glycine zipper 2TM domain-containing protein [Thermomonas]
MKRVLASLLALGLAAGGNVAFAQSAGYGRYDGSVQAEGDRYYDYARVIRVDPVLGGSGYRQGYGSDRRCYETTTAGGYGYGDDGYRNDGRYDGYRNDGYDRRYGGYDGRNDGRYGYGGETGRNVATVVGGIAGAVLGSKVGGGSGSYAAAAVGSMLGGMAGREIYDQNQRGRRQVGTVRVCDPEPVRSGYPGSGYRDGGAGGYDVTYEYNGRRYTRRMDYHPGERVRVLVGVEPQ